MPPDPIAPALFDDYCGVFLTKKARERKGIVTRAIVTADRRGSEAALRREAERLRERVAAARAAASLKEATLALAALGRRMLERYARRKAAARAGRL